MALASMPHGSGGRQPIRSREMTIANNLRATRRQSAMRQEQYQRPKVPIQNQQQSPYVLHVCLHGFWRHNAARASFFENKDIPGTEELGQPEFLHKRMTIHHLGTAEHYLDNEFVQQVIRTFGTPYPVAELGLLPLIRTCEWIRSGHPAISDAAATVEISH